MAKLAFSKLHDDLAGAGFETGATEQPERAPRGCKANLHTAVLRRSSAAPNLPSRRLGQLVLETPFGPKSPNPTRHFQAPRNVTCHVTCRRGLDYWWPHKR
jgi:hypothetical protein